MERFLNWLGTIDVDTIVTVVAAVVSLIIWIVRKRPVNVVDTLKEKIRAELPTVINKAEEVFGAGHGPEKLKFVIDYFTWSFDQEGLKLGNTYIKFIKVAVEQILSTPQKK